MSPRAETPTWFDRSAEQTLGGWLAVGAAVWLSLLAARSVAFVLIAGTGWTNQLVPWFVRAGLLLEGALAVLPLAALVTLLVRMCLVTPAKRARTRRVIGYALLTAVVFIYVASWAAFTSVGQFIDLEAWRFWVANPAQNLKYVAEMEPHELWVVPLIVGIAVVLLASIARAAHAASRDRRRTLVRLAGVTVSVAFGVVIAVTLWARRDATQRLDPATGTSWNALGLYSKLRRDKTGPVSHFAATLVDMMRNDEVARPSPRFAITYPLVADFDDQRLAVPHLATRPNVVVILMESMRADRVFAHRDGRAVMPSVEALARESRVYPRMFAVATHTNYASPAVLSSQYPMRSTTYFTYPRKLTFPHHFLYQHLARHGYRTAFFSSDDENWGGKLNYLDTTSLNRFFHAESFDGPTYRPRGSKVQGAWLALRHAGLPDDRTTVSLATSWVDSTAGAPFFLYVALQNSHTPYEYPATFAAPFGDHGTHRETIRFSGASSDSLRGALDAYDNSLAYDDAQLATLFADLKARKLWDNTIIVLTSDHAEAFDEHGFGIHGNALYDEQVRVPLLLRAPGLSSGIDSTLASTVDIAPTVLDVLGLPPDPGFEGTSLLTAAPDRAVYSVVQSGIVDQYGIVRGDWKLFYDRPSRRYFLYDLATDPQERHNQADSLPARRREMAEQLDTWRWAHLHYYDTAVLRARFFAPRISPCATCAPETRAAR